MNATKEFEAIKESVEAIRSDATQRFPEAASFGDFWRQGDIYITLRESVPSRFVVSKKPNPQLAPGTTQGCRHVLDSLDGVTMYADPRGDALQGPMIESEVEREITHPEHGNVIIPPGCYEITYQRAYAEELRRVQD